MQITPLLHPCKMNTEFITTKEACLLTSRSRTTISKFCIKHKDTQFVRLEKSKYLIDKNYLIDYYSKIDNTLNTPLYTPVNDSVNEPTKKTDKYKTKFKQIQSENTKNLEIISILQEQIKDLKIDKEARTKEISELHYMLAKNDNKVITETTKDNEKNGWQRFLLNVGLIQKDK